MYKFVFVLLMVSCTAKWGQDSSTNNPPTNSPPPNSQPADSASSQAKKPAPVRSPDLSPPRSDRVNAAALPDGESSSKDTQIDLSPPADDAKTHPQSTEAITDARIASEGLDVNEFHPWDPHKAAKDIEVGDFYFKQKNYPAAESRYREALLYKDNDAIATFRLAECLDKMNRPEEAVVGYENYLKILPNGPESQKVKKALVRLKASEADTHPAK
jgi:tetratricopeptide (TPR) repeat protein